MDQFRQSDRKRLLEFIHACSAITCSDPNESYQGKLVAALSRLIPSLHTSYAEVSLDGPEFHHLSSHAEIATPKVDSLLVQYMDGHLPLMHYMQTGDRAVPRISDFQSRSQFHNSALYGAFYRQYDVEDDLCIGIESGPPRCVSVAWHSDRCFTDREQSVAEYARPYVVQAWRNAQVFGELKSQLQLLQRGMESAALGVLSCDAQGRVQQITSLARQYLAAYFDTAKNLDRVLPEELLRWVRAQCAQLKSTDIPPVQLPLVVQKKDRRLTIRLLPNTDSLLLLLEEDAAVQNKAELDELCLSRRESEVLAWVAQGKTNSEIASILGITLATAKKHMEHILLKLGVETRTAAAAIALQTLARR
jgi:DNA-binding CsgD family transcriptional regulator